MFFFWYSIGHQYWANFLMHIPVVCPDSGAAHFVEHTWWASNAKSTTNYSVSLESIQVNCIVFLWRYIYIVYLVGGFSPYPSEKSWSESQLG